MRELKSSEIAAVSGGDWTSNFNTCMSNNFGNNVIVGATAGAFTGGFVGAALGAMGGSTGTFLYCSFEAI